MATGSEQLNEMQRAKAALADAARPDAVQRQHDRGHMTAREALAALIDEDSFVEYGGLARSVIEGIDAPAEGIITGTAKIDGRPVAIAFYDYTVLGGSQSYMGHHKITRIFNHALDLGLPVVCWLDGGGARPQDGSPGRRLAPETFVLFAKLSGQVPTIGVVTQRAFAGHANLAGMCDCLIAVDGAAIGIGGPPLVYAATGARLSPEEIGPSDVHRSTGVIDLAVPSDAEAILAVQNYLSYFGGDKLEFDAPDPAALRDIVPERARRAYDVRKVMRGICDLDTVQELRPDFGKAVITAFGRIAGRTIGIVANQPMFQAGAIDSDAGDKAARFAQLCDAHGVPVLLLCDTPGLMVGPEAEKTGIVRHGSRLLLALANARVPLMSVVLRKAFGLGFYIMGSEALRPALVVAWPGAQYGGMGLEGAVEIAYGREIAALEDPEEQAQLREQYLEKMRQDGSATETAARFLYDDVIDPADTRQRLILTMDTFPPTFPPRRNYVDAI